MRAKYEELRQQLLELVDAAEPGERLPSERELCRRFGVARETLRRALDGLDHDGRVLRRVGAGTYVARSELTQQFRLRSFPEDMAARGHGPTSKVIDYERQAAGTRLAEKLDIAPTVEVLTIQRLRLAVGEPMVLDWLSVPVSLVPGLDPEELAGRSFYGILRDRFEVVPIRASQTMEPTVTDRRESELLGVPPLSPALLAERITWADDGQRVMAMRSIYRGDRYRFDLEFDLARTRST